jgi:signal transduction histidine kinase
MSQAKSERWKRKLTELATIHAGHPLLAELEALLGHYGTLERRLEKIASISDKMQNELFRLYEARNVSEARLAISLQNLERAEAEQRQLLSVASHEFRTPAAMIKASLDSLAILKDRIPPEVALRLENIGQASLRLNKLANNLISHDRLQELALKPRKQGIELGQLVREVVGKYPLPNVSKAHSASNAPFALTVRLPEHPVLIDADSALLGIALHNLIDNALRYHTQPEVPITISLLENRDTAGHWVELRVADQGPGIADDEKEKIFQRFYSSKGGQSDGLGLSIVESVARVHGGSVRVFDNMPSGALLIIRLPISSSPRGPAALACSAKA